MDYHPEGDKEIDTHPNSLDTISTGAKSRHMCQNRVALTCAEPNANANLRLMLLKTVLYVRCCMPTWCRGP